MPGGAVPEVLGTANLERVEAPVTFKAYIGMFRYLAGRPEELR